jgi:hypothetical protein
MIQELTFVDNVMLLTVFEEPRYAVKFSCKSTPKFTPGLGQGVHQPARRNTTRHQYHREKVVNYCLSGFKMLAHPPPRCGNARSVAKIILRVCGGPQGCVRRVPALLSFTHLYSKSYRDARIDRPVPTLVQARCQGRDISSSRMLTRADVHC